jgi:flagellar biosynthetic protein FliP
MNVAAGPTSAVQLAVMLTLISLAPAIVLTCTCFARFAIVFSFLKNGLGTQGAPPSQVLVGLSLFMTAFVMAPVATKMHEQAIAPYLEGKLDEKAAIEAGTPELRKFLLERTHDSDLMIFYEVSDTARPASPDDVPLRIAVPAFVISELRTAFQMGFLMILPFLVIDLVVATILSSLGMVMLPPSIVALPVKLLVFIAVDGWALVVRSLLKGAM